MIREVKPVRSGRPMVDLESLRLERRGGVRRPRTGTAMAAFYDEDGALSLTRVDLVDESDGGLGVRSPVEVGAGVRVCLYLGTLPHWGGTVARCVRECGEFRLGLQGCGRAQAA